MMKFKILKRICISIAGVILIGILIYTIYSIWYYNVGINEYNPEKETTFYRVYGTGFYEASSEYIPGLNGIGTDDVKLTKYCESYIVANAPDNVTELKREIDKFEASIEFEKEALNNDRCVVYTRRYIKESKDMTRDWKPNDTYFDCDREDFHYNHIIAVTAYSKYKNKMIYNIHPKDSNFAEVDRQQFIE